jgi:hypothetical protein
MNRPAGHRIATEAVTPPGRSEHTGQPGENGGFLRIYLPWK